MLNLGIVRPGSTIRIPFMTFDKDDGSSITMTNFAAADILVYKDGSTTERASTAGFTATTDFDAKTGKHVAIIDLADNTTAGFFNAGSEYLVAIDAVTVDAVTTGGWIARFTIGYPDEMFSTTIATLSSQTSFTLTTGPAEDDALNGQWAIIHDIASAVQCSKVLISDYTGSTKTVTLAAGATFTAAAGDNISIMGMAPLQVTVTGRTLDVTATGAAGIDWANVENPTTTLNLSGTSTKALEPTTAGRTLDVSATGEAGLDFDNLKSTSTVTLNALTISGNTTFTGTTAYTGAVTMAAGLTITQSTLNGNGLSITGNGGGRGVRIIGGSSSGTGLDISGGLSDGAGLIIAGKGGGEGLYILSGTLKPVTLENNLGEQYLQTDTVFWNGTAVATPNTAGYPVVTIKDGTGQGEIALTGGAVDTVTNLTNAPTSGDLTATMKASVSTAVWDAATASYGAVGSYGLLVETNLDAAVSTRLASASYTAPLDAAGTRSAVGLASANLDTQLAALPTAAENADAVWDEGLVGHLTAGSTGEALNAAGSAGDPWTTTLPGAYGAGSAGYIIGNNVNAPLDVIDTVVDAIKVKTDSLTFTKAGEVDANIQSVNDVTVTGTGANGDEWGP